MYSTYNEEKYVVAKSIIRTLKNKIDKPITAVSKIGYFDVLNDIVDKYNNTYNRATKMNPIDVKSDSYAKHSVDSNDENHKFKIDNHVRISKYKNIFTNGYAPNWSGEVFVISKMKITVPWTYFIDDLNGEKVVWTFYEKEL